MDDTPQKNRHFRAMVASIRETSREQSTRGHDRFFEFNHKMLSEHAPSEGSAPVCTAPDCGNTWPCGMAESAMIQVGVRE